MNKEYGFILPFTLVTITIVLFSLTTLAFLYKQEIDMTANIREQFVVESLFSLAENQSETELLKNEPLPGNQTYAFPHGKVEVSYSPMNSYFRIFYDIETTKGAFYSMWQSYAWTVQSEESSEYIP